MSVDLTSSAITHVHRDLLGHLATLDRLGEHVAAAHLAAAVDALEERLDAAEPAIEHSRKDDPVEAMARGLIARFDHHAREVARRQIEVAAGPSLLTWAAVASRIELILAKRG